MASAVISRFSPPKPSIWNISQSLGGPLAAMPKFSRPSAMWSMRPDERLNGRVLSSWGAR